jgi:uncharacterized membrane protein YedE/YeeE
MTPYLPWWLGALALGLVAAGFRLTRGRPLGVSGSLHKTVAVRQTRALDAAREAMAHDEEVQRALMEATLAAFTPEQRAAAALAPAAPAQQHRAPPLAWVEHVAVVVGLVVGGAAARLVMGPGVASAPGWMDNTAQGALAATGVGLLVGLGARLMGGCTSGHGLGGCSSLKTDSMLATALFLGSAMAFSWLLGG